MLVGAASLASSGVEAGAEDEVVDEVAVAATVTDAAITDAAITKADQPRERPRTIGRPADTRGGTVAVDRHGLLVVERNAGELIRANREGKRRAGLQLGPGLGELVLDHRGHAFVADRSGDRIVRVDVDHPERLHALASASVPEPHGLALTPDGATLLITSVSARALVALDADTLAPKWRVELAPEPRAVAVAPDGSHAAVGFLSSGSLALVELGSGTGSGSGTPRVRWRSLEPRDHVETVREDGGCGGEFLDSRIVEARSRFSVPVETGRRYVRGVFSLAFVGDGELVAPHQLATPQLQRVVARESSDSYGGQSASISAIEHQVARVRGVGELETTLASQGASVRQPRALAYDAAEARLYVGGYGDDRIAVFTEAEGALRFTGSRVVTLAGSSCGLDGLAIEAPEHGGGLWAHCEFGRALVRVELEFDEHDRIASSPRQHAGEVLAESLRSAQIEQGADLFRRNDFRLSGDGDLACTSCHPEGRSDGLTWRLGGAILQAPMLAGRLSGTAPYKWDGQDVDLHASVRHTTARLGGFSSAVSKAEYDALVAYLESLPAPKPLPTTDDKAVTRGRAVFEQAGCDACHSGELLTDAQQYALDTSLRTVDTPSLIGLAHSRPYFHDGSAPDLWTLLTDRGTVHDMADTSDLSDAQLHDLVAYLESL